MDELGAEDKARNRWLIIQTMRLVGVAMVVIALLALQGLFPLPDMAAYVLLVAGLVDVFLVPTLLARKWSSRGE